MHACVHEHACDECATIGHPLTRNLYIVVMFTFSALIVRPELKKWPLIS